MQRRRALGRGQRPARAGVWSLRWRYQWANAVGPPRALTLCSPGLQGVLEMAASAGLVHDGRVQAPGEGGELLIVGVWRWSLSNQTANTKQSPPHTPRSPLCAGSAGPWGTLAGGPSWDDAQDLGLPADEALPPLPPHLADPAALTQGGAPLPPISLPIPSLSCLITSLRLAIHWIC